MNQNQNQNVKILCNGEYGGGDFDNLTSYSVFFDDNNNSEFVVLDAGTLNTNWEIESKPKFVFLSHAHIDHTKDFLLNLDKFLGIPIITDITKADLNELQESLGKQINRFSKYRNDDVKKKLSAIKISELTIIPPSDLETDNVEKKKKIETKHDLSDFNLDCFRLNHGNYNKNGHSSWAISIRKDGFKPIIYFGDCTYDKEFEKTKNYFSKIQEFSVNKNIIFEYIFLECAFDNKTPKQMLFGHMQPTMIKELMDDFPSIFKYSNIIITHRKPAIKFDEDNGTFSFDDTEIKQIKKELAGIGGFQNINGRWIKKKTCYPIQNKKILNSENTEHSTLSDISGLYTLDEYRKQIKLNPERTIKDLFNLVVISATFFGICYQKNYKFSVSEEEYNYLKALMNDKFWPNILLTLFTYTGMPNNVGGYLKSIKKRRKKNKNRKKSKNKKNKKNARKKKTRKRKL